MTESTRKIIQILPNNKHGDEHRGTKYYYYNFIALCDDGSLWGITSSSRDGACDNWERIA